MAVWFARLGPEVAVEAGAPGDLDALLDEAALAMDEPGAPTRAPDRLRVMVIPDAPGASWGVSE